MPAGSRPATAPTASNATPNDIPRLGGFDKLGRPHFDMTTSFHVTPATGCGRDDARLVDAMSYGVDPTASKDERDAAAERVLNELDRRGLVQAITCDGGTAFVERLPDAAGWFAYYADTDGRDLLGFATTQWITVDTTRLTTPYPG